MQSTLKTHFCHDCRDFATVALDGSCESCHGCVCELIESDQQRRELALHHVGPPRRRAPDDQPSVPSSLSSPSPALSAATAVPRAGPPPQYAPVNPPQHEQHQQQQTTSATGRTYSLNLSLPAIGLYPNIFFQSSPFETTPAPNPQQQQGGPKAPAAAAAAPTSATARSVPPPQPQATAHPPQATTTATGYRANAEGNYARSTASLSMDQMPDFSHELQMVGSMLSNATAELHRFLRTQLNLFDDGRTPQVVIDSLLRRPHVTPKPTESVQARTSRDDTAGVVEAADSACAICRDTIEEGMMEAVLPCGHAFHENCIVEWLKQSRTCPLCRAQLPSANDLH